MNNLFEIILNNIPTCPEKIESRTNIYHSFYRGGPKDEVFGPSDFTLTYHNDVKVIVTEAKFKWLKDVLVIRGNVTIRPPKRRHSGYKETSKRSKG